MLPRKDRLLTLSRAGERGRVQLTGPSYFVLPGKDQHRLLTGNSTALGAGDEGMC